MVGGEKSKVEFLFLREGVESISYSTGMGKTGCPKQKANSKNKTRKEKDLQMRAPKTTAYYLSPIEIGVL